jgi:hypothetical protein
MRKGNPIYKRSLTVANIDFSAPLKANKVKKIKAVVFKAPTPAPPQLLDLEAIKTALVPYHAQVEAMIAEASNLKVADEITNTRATEIGNTARKIEKAVEAIKKDEPYTKAKEFINGIGNLIKSFTEPLANQVVRPLKAQQSAYADRLLLEQQRREAAAREAARIQQARVEAEARLIREEAERKAREAEALLKNEKDEAARLALQKTFDDEKTAASAPTPQYVAPVVEQSPTVTRTGAGSSFAKRPWKAFLVDEAKVDREFLVVDMVKVNRAVASGRREIPGFDVRQVTETSYRR